LDFVLEKKKFFYDSTLLTDLPLSAILDPSLDTNPQYSLNDPILSVLEE